MARTQGLPRYTEGTSTSLTPFSNQTKKWLLNLAHIKFQVDVAASGLSDRTYISNREDEYRRWSRGVEERGSRENPVTEDEAWSYLVDNRGLWVWTARFRSITKLLPNDQLSTSEQVQATVEARKEESTVFVNLGYQLSQTACALDIADLSKLSEVINAVELQLSVLGSFGELYYRKAEPSGHIYSIPFKWHIDLRPNIRQVVDQANSQKARFSRTPSQHYQDNFLLQALICVFLLGCIYPLVRVLKSSSPLPGSTSEAEFWQQIINLIIQLASFLTLLLPIYRETAAKEWIGTWILTILGILSAVLAVSLYCFAPISWSAFFSWLASAAQLLVVLQVALVATFRDQEHAKRE